MHLLGLKDYVTHGIDVSHFHGRVVSCSLYPFLAELHQSHHILGVRDEVKRGG